MSAVRNNWRRCLAARPTATPLSACPSSSPSTTTGIAVLRRNRHFSQSCLRPRDHRDPHEQLRNARPLLSPARAQRALDFGTGRKSRYFAVLCAAAAAVFYLANTQVIPASGRRRFNFMSEDLMKWIGDVSVEGVRREIEDKGGRILPESDARVAVVRRVMSRLIPVSGMADNDWEIHVIDAGQTANAFVTPGGKLFVFSGLLNVCRNQDALAAVLGHEIAHNTAAHSGERMSAGAAGWVTSASLFFLIGPLRGLALALIWSAAGGWYLSDLLLQFPMTRTQESEADHIGLMMMAEACYDPREAVGFWRRMNALKEMGGREVPEMLSTHPSNDHRIDKLNEWMPEALRKRAESDCAPTRAWADQFRDAMHKSQWVYVLTA
ncbi:hypothetical protein N3K66_004266 [Trichothecium roseum]|uniref:Uncharacterized protein n=1 Tax=Trichothecium roseum TaxID=47278 RepID=A0ACC0V288_9HYPO|nr:hypothetical protein N3K66_004266 [Trichothecium roseum]